MRTHLAIVPTTMQDGAQGASTRRRLFQGSIGSDIVYFAFDVTPQAAFQHWVVLEEPPHGSAFFNTAPPQETQRIGDMHNAADGASFAAAAFADPIRVVLRGDELIPGGG